MPMISSTIAVVRTAPMRGVDEVVPAHLPVDEDRDQQRIEHGDAGAFGRGEDARAHAAEDDGDQQQAGNGDSDEMQPTAAKPGNGSVG